MVFLSFLFVVFMLFTNHCGALIGCPNGEHIAPEHRSTFFATEVIAIVIFCFSFFGFASQCLEVAIRDEFKRGAEYSQEASDHGVQVSRRPAIPPGTHVD